MNIKKTILAPAVLTLGSLSVAAGVVAPVVSTVSTGYVTASAASPGAVIRGG